jgi:hypothetical protein
MKKLMVLAVAAAFAGVATAQNDMAFKDAEFVDVFINQNGNSFTLTLGANPMVDASIGAAGFASIKDVSGFWLISDDGDLRATGQDFGDYKWHENIPGSGKNATFGFQTMGNQGLKAGDSQVFTFDSINGGGIDGYGLKLNAQGTPAHVRFNNAQPIPEPASILAFASGAVVLLRRRRNKK